MNTIKFKPFPEFETNQCQLRQLNKGDAEKIFEIRSNIVVAKYLDRPKTKDLECCRGRALHL